MKTFIVFAICVAVAVAAPPSKEDGVTVLKYDTDVNESGYKFAYETSDGVVREESGEIKSPANEDTGISVRGSYSYVYDGVTYTVNFVADENGFQPEGAHIPK